MAVNNPLWYLKLDGSAQDSSWNKIHATANGAVSWVTGKAGQAAQFGGADTDYIESNGNVGAVGTVWSVEGWIKPDVLTGSGRFLCLDDGMNGLLFRRAGATAEVRWLDSGAAYRTLASGVILVAGQWVHVVATHTGTTTKLYANGSLVGTDSTYDSKSMPAGHWFVGRAALVVGEPFDGAVDEVRIYDRALSPDDVLYRYHNPGGPEWEIELEYGTGWTEIYEHAEGIRKTQRLHNDLKPTVNTCSFQLNDKTLANAIIGADNYRPVRIGKNAAPWFVGLVRPTFGASIAASLDGMPIECVDKSILLHKKINKTLYYASYKVCNPSNKAASILHQLFYEAGIVDAELNLTLIDKTIDYIAVEPQDNLTYDGLIKSLLYEFGYVYDFGDDGIAVLHDLYPTSYSTTAIADADMDHPLKIDKKERQYEAVRVEWNPHETLTGQLVFSDATGGDGTHPCNISLGTGEYYPEGSDVRDVYCEYRVEGYDLILVQSAALDWVQTGVTLDTFTAGYKRALLKTHAAASGTITRLNITGNAVVRNTNAINRSVRYVVVSTERILDLRAQWITASGDADRLSNGIASWLTYADFSYRFKSELVLTPGTILALTEAVLSLNTTLRVVEVREDDRGVREIVAEGMAEYVVGTITREDSISSPAGTTEARDDGELYVTHEEDQEGYDTAGGTTTPTVPSALAYPNFNFITLAWDKQLNLTNLDRYEVQVSPDAGATWYPLDFSGLGYVSGSPGGDTDWPLERLVHNDIPWGGTEEDPNGTTYQYRVRRVTKNGTQSSWSTTTSATTNPVGKGDLAANIISANKAEIGFLNALVAEIQSYLVISDTLGWVAGNYATPGNTDQRSYLDKNEIRVQYHNGSAWQDRFVLVSADATDAYTLTLTSCPLVLDTIKARTASGFMLFEDSGTYGITVGDDGSVSIAAGNTANNYTLALDRRTGKPSIKGVNTTSGKDVILDAYAADNGVVALQYNIVGDVVLCYGGGTGGGTIGLGTNDLEAWSANYLALQWYGSAIMAARSDNDIHVVSNAYQEGATWKYRTTDAAAKLRVYATDRELRFETAASGTIDTAISLQAEFIVVGGADTILNLGGAAGGSNRNVYLYLATDAYLKWAESTSSIEMTAPSGGQFGVFVTGFGTALLANASGLWCNTGTTAGNANVNHTGSAYLLRSTSSLRYKIDVRDLPREIAEVALRLRPIVFRSLCEIDDKDMIRIGFAAEEVHALGYPGLVNYIKEGGELVPDGVGYQAIVPIAIAAIQNHEARIKTLELAK